jgi:hypothetical protein
MASSQDPASSTGPALSIAALFSERDEQRRRDREAAEQLERRKEEEGSAFKKRLDELELTEEIIQSGLARIRRAFEHGETELMITSFPTGFCTDDGRAVINAGAPPINKPTKEEAARLTQEPEWVATMPKGVRKVYDYWKANLKDGGFGFTARVIDYPGGKPGNIGLFFSWPKSALEA